MTIEGIPSNGKYTVGKAKYRPDVASGIDVVESYVFDITEEADYLTASCPELHLIVSAPDWESLEMKINNVYYDKVMGDEKDGQS